MDDDGGFNVTRLPRGVLAGDGAEAGPRGGECFAVFRAEELYTALVEHAA